MILLNKAKNDEDVEQKYSEVGFMTQRLQKLKDKKFDSELRYKQVKEKATE